MRKLKIYLDTTIPSYVFNDHVADKQKASKALFDQIKEGLFEAFVSEVVIRELSMVPEPRQSDLYKLIQNLSILTITEESEKLALEYVERRIIPQNKLDDARHIAIATLFELDALISYNFEHIVRMKTIDGVTAVNLLEGLRTLRILSPEEVLLDV